LSAGPDLEPFGPGEPGCVFCHPEASPGVLVENEHIRLIPDLYPVAPGHVLLVSKRHLPCYGDAPAPVLEALQELSDDAAGFVRNEYAVEPVLWENGGAGQTVFHAHLHVMPVALPAIEEVIESEHMREVGGWDDVARLYRDHGAYHYLQFREHRRLIEGNGEMNWEFRRRVAIAAGMRFEAGRLVRPTTHEDVEEVATRWRDYSRGRVSVSWARRGRG
jgi:diadenosine tetraphosphate (Ap4A) HIT family hydrolase